MHFFGKAWWLDRMPPNCGDQLSWGCCCCSTENAQYWELVDKIGFFWFPAAVEWIGRFYTVLEIRSLNVELFCLVGPPCASQCSCEADDAPTSPNRQQHTILSSIPFHPTSFISHTTICNIQIKSNQTIGNRQQHTIPPSFHPFLSILSDTIG